MRSMLTITLMIAIAIFFSSCDQVQSWKWFDYGNGMINLTRVEQISFGTQATYENTQGNQITRPCESVLEQYDKDNWKHDERLKKAIKCDAYVAFDLFKVTVGSNILITQGDIELSDKKAEETLERIREFIQGRESYLRF